MNNVVITGSARGFGFAMLKLFYEAGDNVVLVDINEESLAKAKEELEKEKKPGKVLSFVADVTDLTSLQNVVNGTKEALGSIDIWINNAGVNQLMKPVWELDEKTITRLMDIDLKGAILGSRAVLPLMIKQNKGQVYFVEGFGSDNATLTGLTVYGTAKRGVTYFAEGLTKEIKDSGKNIQIGKITPGIMITNFINHSLGDGEKFELSEQTKKVYNILGDYPETIAQFMVRKIRKNTKNGAKFAWLTKARAFGRFMKAPFNKRDFFAEEKK